MNGAQRGQHGLARLVVLFFELSRNLFELFHQPLSRCPDLAQLLAEILRHLRPDALLLPVNLLSQPDQVVVCRLVTGEQRIARDGLWPAVGLAQGARIRARIGNATKIRDEKIFQ